MQLYFYSAIILIFLLFFISLNDGFIYTRNNKYPKHTSRFMFQNNISKFKVKTMFPETIQLKYQQGYANVLESFDNFCMGLALEHAKAAFDSDEVPVGAVVVSSTGEIMSSGRNRVEFNKDASAHAEIEALKNAARAKKDWRLNDMTLYVTLEPCSMCREVIKKFRIQRVVFGAPNLRKEVQDSSGYGKDFNIVGGIKANESTVLLKKFFERQREKDIFNRI